MARRKIADPAVLAVLHEIDEDLPELTPQQMAYVQARLEGKSGTEAYRLAYDCSGMQPQTIWVAASRLGSSSKIALWLAATRKAHLGASVLTLGGHMTRLEELSQLALEAGNHGAAMQGEIHRGKAAGLYVERHEHTHTLDIVPELQRLAQVLPEYARQIAQQHGIDWRKVSPDVVNLEPIEDDTSG